MTDIDLLRALNTDIWEPFPRSYVDGDPEAHLALFAPELIRAGGGQVLDHAAYAEQIREFFQQVSRRGDAVRIAFRFTDRLAAGGLACERGVFEITVDPAGGERRVSYGRFHTFARLIDQRWRIVADHDSPRDLGGPVTAEHFAAATPVADLAVFAD
jgi:uncharacterized protein DUF4440